MPENSWGGELHESQWSSPSTGAVCQWSVDTLVPHYVVGLTLTHEWWLLLASYPTRHGLVVLSGQFLSAH